MGDSSSPTSVKTLPRELIRNYTLYAISVFKDFGEAEMEEVNLVSLT